MAFDYLNFNDKSLAQHLARPRAGTVMVRGAEVWYPEWCDATGLPPNRRFNPLIYSD
jgi:hypothetical protein